MGLGRASHHPRHGAAHPARAGDAGQSPIGHDWRCWLELVSEDGLRHLHASDALGLSLAAAGQVPQSVPIAGVQRDLHLLACQIEDVGGRIEASTFDQAPAHLEHGRPELRVGPRVCVRDAFPLESETRRPTGQDAVQT